MVRPQYYPSNPLGPQDVLVTALLYITARVPGGANGCAFQSYLWPFSCLHADFGCIWCCGSGHTLPSDLGCVLIRIGFGFPAKTALVGRKSQWCHPCTRPCCYCCCMGIICIRGNFTRDTYNTCATLLMLALCASYACSVPIWCSS